MYHDGVCCDCNLLPLSIPLTMVSDTVRSTDFKVSFAASVTVFLWMRLVEKRRGACWVKVTDCLRIGCVLVRKDMVMLFGGGLVLW